MPAFASNWFKAASASPSAKDSAAVQSSSSRSNNSPPSDNLDLDSDAIFVDDDDDTTTAPPSLTFSRGPSSPESSNSNSLSDHPKMQVSSASPIDIATPTRNSSSSPSSQAAQKANYIDQDSRASAIMNGAAMDNGMGRGVRQDSFAGAKPISMNNPNRNLDARPRRESMANSLVGGMSWGGVSVGSWIRDDIIMAGTSPFPYQSPSYHSSSYLPKLEANFMRDFSCCGQTLPTLHDLLQHYEESHAQQTPHSHRASSAAARARENSTPNSKAALAAQANLAVQQQAHQHIQQPQQNRVQMQQGGAPVGGIQLMRQQQSQPQTPVQQNVQPVSDEMEGVEDMEMDDGIGPLDQAPPTPMQAHQQPVQNMQPSMFGQQPRPNLNINSNGLQHSGLRTSQPPTPSVSGFGFQNNPTVSSVNTPTLSAQPFQQQQQTFSPDTSVPGTPAGEMDDDYGNAQMNMMNNPNLAALNAAMAAGDFPFFPNGNGGQMGLDSLGLDLCIDEPAKRLYSPNGGYNNQRQMQQQFAQFGLGQAQGQFGNNDHLMRLYRQQQAMALGGMGNGMMMGGEEHKPFRCPVIGCEKAYKNQNGLKYHKTHGHQTQRLHENGDGTFSIVNPETSAPYPGTLGMEKEKPYKCEVCGKRYKNLNGLKYHKQHSPPCNPELKLNSHMAAVGLGGLGVNVNVAGLPGIGEEGFIS